MSCTARSMNTVLISGLLESDFEFSHSLNSGITFLKSSVTVFRPNSTKFDHVPVTVRSDRINSSFYRKGDSVKIEGKLISYRSDPNRSGISRYSCMIQSIDHYSSDAENLNSVSIVGSLLKNPYTKMISPDVQVTNLSVKVKRSEKTSDHITVVAWNELSEYGDLLLVGDTVSASGHLKVFAKKNTGSNSEVPTLQVVASELSLIKDENAD